MSTPENKINKLVTYGHQPLVSVIVPVYNSEKTIIETLTSIFSQDYGNIEIIVINDGSTDRTKEILEQHKDKLKIIDQTNSGAAVARTRGIKQAQGKYIAFIDADDLWVPWKIRTQVGYIEQHQEIGMVFNKWILLNDASDTLPTAPQDSIALNCIEEENSGWLYTRLLMECVVHTSSVLIAKRICDEVGEFDPSLRLGEDYDYWLRVSQVTQIMKLKSVLSAYRIHADNITKKIPEINFEAILLSKSIQNFGLHNQNGTTISHQVMNQRLAESWGSFCWQTYHAGQYKKSFSSALNILKLRPFLYKGWLYLIASLAKIIVNTPARN